MRAEYVLYKAKYNGSFQWRMRYLWDEQSGKYLKSRSLGIFVDGKKKDYRQAEHAAIHFMEKLQAAAVSDSGQEVAVVPRPVLGKPEIGFLSYIKAFWTLGSDYIEEQRIVNKAPLSSLYISNNLRNIRLHVEPCPLFANLSLSGLNKKIIRDYKLWGAKKGMSGDLVNKCLQTMKVPIRYAVANGDLPADPFYGSGKAYHVEKIKGVLTANEREHLIYSEVTDYYARLAVMLGVLCGMRRGEIRGILWGDIGEGIIIVRHNFVDGDGMKNPKCKGGLVRENTRIVPMPQVVADMLTLVYKFAGNPGPDDFVIQSLRCKGVPVSAKYFDHALKRELSGIGLTIEEQKKRNITFHSTRHSYVTHGRLAKISDIEMQAFAGQSARMMERYSHPDQVIDMALAKIKFDEAYLPASIENDVIDTAPSLRPKLPQALSVKWYGAETV